MALKLTKGSVCIPDGHQRGSILTISSYFLFNLSPFLFGKQVGHGEDRAYITHVHSRVYWSRHATESKALHGEDPIEVTPFRQYPLIDPITAEPKEATIKNVGNITSGHGSICDFEFGGSCTKCCLGACPHEKFGILGPPKLIAICKVKSHLKLFTKCLKFLRRSFSPNIPASGAYLQSVCI